jgi:transposase-like protein
MLKCPACKGSGVVRGTLGRIKWYRCQDCGLDFYKEKPRRFKGEGRGPACHVFVGAAPLGRALIH